MYKYVAQTYILRVEKLTHLWTNVVCSKYTAHSILAYELVHI